MSNKFNEILNKSSYDINDLVEIVKILRSPEGCPWDREQTHRSIRRDLLEEAYEVAEAIDRGSSEGMCEELGDLLLQVVFHSEIASEQGEFELSDAIDGVCKKMILRHPHVFGNLTADSTDEVLKNWDAIKRDEKQLRTPADELDAVAHTLPALMRAAKLSSKCRKLGLETTLPKSEDDADRIADELFTLAEKARELGLDPEKLLSDRCDRLIEAQKH